MAWPFRQLYRQHITCSPQVPSKDTLNHIDILVKCGKPKTITPLMQFLFSCSLHLHVTHFTSEMPQKMVVPHGSATLYLY